MKVVESSKADSLDITMTPNPIHVIDTTTKVAGVVNSHEDSEKCDREESVLKGRRIKLNWIFSKYSAVDKPNTSIVIVGAIVFIGDTSRGILFPILSTLCTQLGGSVIDLGYLVAMFSIGRLITTTPLGFLSDKYRHRLPLLISSSILAIGASLWANAFTTNRLSVLYTAQFLLGVGSGSLGVTRSFVVEQCDPQKRTEALALLTALQYAGFTVSPIVGSWLHTVGGGRSRYLSFALPSYLIALMAVCSLIALLLLFKNIPATVVEYENLPLLPSQEIVSCTMMTDINNDSPKASPLHVTSTSTSPLSHSRVIEENDCHLSPSIDKHDIENRIDFTKITSAVNSEKRSLGYKFKKLKNGTLAVIIGMCLLNVTTKGSIAVYETLGAQIGLIDYNMSTVALGALVSGSGAVGFCQLLLFPRFWTKYFSDIQLMLIGLAIMIVAQLIGLSYGSMPQYERYLTSVVLMYAFGYPVGHTAVLGAFSKIQKSGPQAAMMGWFATSGSLARILLPILSGYLDKLVDNSPFNIVLFLLSLSYLGIILLKSHIETCIVVDYNISKSEKEKENRNRNRNENEDGNGNRNGNENENENEDGNGNENGNEEKEEEMENKISNSYSPEGIKKYLFLPYTVWRKLSNMDRLQALIMIFVIIFTVVDLVFIAGGVRDHRGFDIPEDEGLDVD